jgi:hypothetical protein
MKNLRNLKIFELGTVQKTSNISRSVFNVRTVFTGINAEIYVLSDDMPLVVEHSILEEIFAIYPMGTHGIRFLNRSPMGDPCKALLNMRFFQKFGSEPPHGAKIE